MKLLSIIAFGLAVAGGMASTFVSAQGIDDEFDNRQWSELVLTLPAYPKTENLVKIWVSAASNNTFLVDTESISVGEDGVIRYTLVVKSDSGAMNVSYEGMRCDSIENKRFAFGHPDNTWAKARNSTWLRIRENGLNRQHAELFKNYFCPYGVSQRTAKDAVEVLKRGGIKY